MPGRIRIARRFTARRYAASPDFTCTRHHGAGRTVKLVVRGELDLATSAELEHALSDAQPRIVLDLRALSFMDCSSLSILVSATDQARAAGGRLRVVPGSPAVDRLFRLTGIERRLEMTS
ncbi:STAS domain-containing protein [Solirubrobacter taibaiensis]|nr:STAS domain-containing protein [Solirubrobacter taibaiensis]